LKRAGPDPERRAEPLVASSLPKSAGVFFSIKLRPDYVWATDITYIADGARRRLSRSRDGLRGKSWPGDCRTQWRLRSVNAVEGALAKHGCSQIFKANQGSQLTSAESPAG
jgi:hypothetical protein